MHAWMYRFRRTASQQSLLITVIVILVVVAFETQPAWGQTGRDQRGETGNATTGATSSDPNENAQGERLAAPQTGGANQIDESELVGLPLNGRSYSQLATLQAGV